MHRLPWLPTRTLLGMKSLKSLFPFVVVPRWLIASDIDKLTMRYKVCKKERQSQSEKYSAEGNSNVKMD
jgi:hypothetical protein